MVRRLEHAGQTWPTSPVLPATDDPATTTPLSAATTTPVSAAALEEVEADDEQARLAAESLERRQADLEIRNELALAGFRGPGWDGYASELARYGYAVMMAWFKTGEIFRQCKAKGCGVGSAPLDWAIDDRAGLANETVALAVNSFKQQALIKGKWTPKGGATLTTYFIGACVFAFPNLYRKWLTDRATLQHLTNTEHAPIVRSSPPQDPCEIAVTRLYIREGFNEIPDDRTKCAVLLQAMGYTYSEISEMMQITSRAVDGLIRRQHERGAGKRGGGRHD